MSFLQFHLGKLRLTQCLFNRGKFSTWTIENFYWHKPTKFNVANRVIFVFSQKLDQILAKQIWHLIGPRQHFYRILQTIKGFILFIGIDMLNLNIVFARCQIEWLRLNLKEILGSFLESVAHNNLKNLVCG